MKTETVEEFILRKLQTPEFKGHVSRTRRLGVDEKALHDVARSLRTLYWARYGANGGSVELFKVLLRDSLEDLASRKSVP